MPRDITCHNCLGSGKGHKKNIHGDIIPTDKCVICNGRKVLTIFTQTDINKAVQDEREAIIELGADIIRKHFIDITSDQVEILTRYAEAIRARNK